MVDGNSTLVNSMQFSKHLAGMTLIESGMEMVLRLIQPLKAFCSILFTLDGITTPSMSQQFSKALHFIVSIPSRILLILLLVVSILEVPYHLLIY